MTTLWQKAGFSLWMAAGMAVLFVTMALAFGVCGRSRDVTLARIELVSHYGDGGNCDWNGECGSGDNTGYDGRGDNENSRRRNRGAFSPGPFDRSPIEMHDVDMCISLDCSGRDKKDDKKSPSGQRPQSLLPIPTPGGIQKFVLATVEAGIGLGKLFANATIDFVSSLMVGIA